MKKVTTANPMRDGLFPNQTSNTTQQLPFSVVTVNAGSSVIQTNPQKGPVNNPGMPGNTALDDDAEKQCRELLARRPSYRKLLKDLSSSDPDIKSRLIRDPEEQGAAHQDIINTINTISSQAESGRGGISDESNGSETGSDDDSDSRDQRRLDDDGDQVGSTGSSSAHDRLQGPQPMHIQQQQPQFAFPGLQMGGMGGPDDGSAERAYQHALAMNNSAAQSGQALQHRQDMGHPAGQHLAALLPQSSGYQLAPGVIMSGSNQNSISAAMAVMGQGASPPVGEEVARKREMRLLKNREAARECRRKKKEYVKCLENRVAVLEAQNKALIDELKSLKELYCQQGVKGGPD